LPRAFRRRRRAVEGNHRRGRVRRRRGILPDGTGRQPLPGIRDVRKVPRDLEGAAQDGLNPSPHLPMKFPLRFSFSLALLLTGAPLAKTPTSAPTAPAVDPFWPADGKFPVPGKTSSWTGFRNNNTQRRTLFAQRKALDRDGIVFVGDSITQG